jgi:hypothetical protein
MKNQKSEVHTYFNKAGTKYLKDNGIDPHGIKYDTLGENTPVSDATGMWMLTEIFGCKKNGSGNWTPAYENIGR